MRCLFSLFSPVQKIPALRLPSDSIPWEKVRDRRLTLPILREANADQEASGEFAGLCGKNSGKTGGVGDLDGGYHPGRGAVSVECH